MKLTISKYSGAGNTFVILEQRPLSQKRVKELCASYETDGLIMIQGFSMSYFNADGGEAAMCGNGLRCVIKYLWDRGIRQELYTITTKAGPQRGKVEGECVTCFLQPPSKLEWDRKITIEGKELPFHFINSGVDHAVLFDKAHFVWAEKIRYHPSFAPHGTNVNFVTDIVGNEITLRTYERGVERETLACGTGAVASALAAARNYGLSSPIRVGVRSNEFLEVGFAVKNGHFADITLKGSASCVIVDGE